jgi:hypothetical protein
MKALIERTGGAMYAELDGKLLGKFYRFYDAVKAIRVAGGSNQVIEELKRKESLLHGTQGEYKGQIIIGEEK